MSAVSTPATSPASTFSIELPSTPGTPPSLNPDLSTPLQDVPLEYIARRLHDLAPFYWKRADTTNCAIHFPVDLQQVHRAMARRAAGVDSATSVFASSSSSRQSFSAGVFAGSGSLADQRRGSAPVSTPMRVVRLHMEYLSTQSALLRSLFSRSSHLDIAPTLQTSNPCRPFAPPHTSFRFPSHQTPRLLPSSTVPSIYLPIPDPASFPLLVHYLYFGKVEYIERALAAGEIQWEGTVRNVEYLGLGSEIKCFLGMWWAKWVETHEGVSAEPVVMEETDSDDECMDEDDEYYEDSGVSNDVPSLSFSFSDPDVDEETDVEMSLSDEEDDEFDEKVIEKTLLPVVPEIDEDEELVRRMSRC